MAETITALLFAHVLADYVFQTGWMVQHKRRLPVIGLHIAIVALTAWIALGFTAPALVLGISLLHLVIDQTKLTFGQDNLAAYVADQTAHILSILVLVPLSPLGWEHGIWADILPSLTPNILIMLAGLIFATRAGGFAIAMLIAPFLNGDVSLRQLLSKTSLKGAGETIGFMERGLAYVLIIAGYPAGIAVLVAAKSILRFSDAQKNRKVAEYVIIGTLGSIGWAVLTALSVTYILRWL